MPAKSKKKNTKRKKQKAPDHLTSVKFLPPSSLELQFADKTFILPIKRLDMPTARIDWQTADCAPTGEKMTVQGTNGGELPIDSATLRYLVDRKYAAKIDKSIHGLHLTPAEFDAAAKKLRNPAWNDVGDEDDLL